MIGGKPKAGKSYLALGWTLAVADGGETLGEKVDQGDVLYAALEDGYRRLRDRLDQVLGIGVPAPEGAWFTTGLPRAGRGLLENLEKWLGEHPRARLIIIDTLINVKPPALARRDQQGSEVDHGVMHVRRHGDEQSTRSQHARDFVLREARVREVVTPRDEADGFGRIRADVLDRDHLDLPLGTRQGLARRARLLLRGSGRVRAVAALAV